DEDELVIDERIRQLRLEVLEGEIDSEAVRVLAKKDADEVQIGARGPVNHGCEGTRIVDAWASHKDNGTRMPVVEGFVIAEQDVESVRAAGDTAEVRTTIDASRGCERLEQRVIRFSPGRSLARGGDGRQEVLFVVAGTGTLELDGEQHALEPWTAAFVAP